MGIRASVLVTSYNKNDVLPNVFHSISRQRTDFEFEVCFLDDCSLVDPRSIYDEHLRVEHKKGVRLHQHIGNRGNQHCFPRHPEFTSSYGMTFQMADEQSEVIVVQSADVVWTQDDILQKFVDGMEENHIQICCVKNLQVDLDLWQDFETRVRPLIERSPKDCSYQGTCRGPLSPEGRTQEWYDFLMPFYRKDMVGRLQYVYDNRDTTLNAHLQKHYTPDFRDDIVGIHQAHSPLPCTFVLHDDDLWNWGSQHPDREVYGEK